MFDTNFPKLKINLELSVNEAQETLILMFAFRRRPWFALNSTFSIFSRK